MIPTDDGALFLCSQAEAASHLERPLGIVPQDGRELSGDPHGQLFSQDLGQVVKVPVEGCGAELLLETDEHVTQVVPATFSRNVAWRLAADPQPPHKRSHAPAEMRT